MDETLRSNQIKKRLSMQNEVLKWLSEFSEKLQKRASDAATEVHGLLDQAGAVELDLKNTFNSFHNLSYNQFIDHASTAPNGVKVNTRKQRINDEDDVAYHMKESGKRSVETGIPAQNYETDILPRYKEALSLGLTFCKNHLQSTKKSQSTSSIFRTGSAHGLLPHIIGSEEYIHDNSCGLTEDFALGTPPLDFSWIVEPTGMSADADEHDPPDLFGSHMFGMQQGSSGKDGTQPLVSAALDFKAMLEAALLNPYKFYDEESLSVHDAVNETRSTGQTRKDVDLVASTSSEAIAVGSFQHLDIAEEKIMPATEGNLTSLQDPGIHNHEVYSALVSGSLFDTEEDLPSPRQEQSLNTPDSVAAGPDTSVNINEEEIEQKATSEDVDALDKDVAISSLTLLPNTLKDGASTSSMDSDRENGVSEEPKRSDQS